MNVVRLVIFVSAVGLAAALMQVQGRDAAQRQTPLAPTAPIAPPRGGPYHGVAIQVHHADGAVETNRRLIREIAALGADTVAFSTAAYQDHAGATDLAIDPTRTASPQQWAELMAAARQRGLRRILMPIVLLRNPRGTEWRGIIYQNDWDAWFERYRKVVLHFARIAAANEIEIFMVGSELVSTVVHTAQWRRVIGEVREIYSGQLGYSANWDVYQKPEFWNDLDLVGMTSYHKLADKPGASVDTLVAAWKPIKNDIMGWQRKIRKPILFTEVGWCSQEGCAVEAWNYYRQEKTPPAGLEEQRRCYEAFCRTWADTPEVGGMIWWEWTSRPGGRTDFGYTPKGKPAETTLRAWFAEQRRIRERQNAATKPDADPPREPEP